MRGKGGGSQGSEGMVVVLSFPLSPLFLSLPCSRWQCEVGRDAAGGRDKVQGEGMAYGMRMGRCVCECCVRGGSVWVCGCGCH